MAWQQKAKNGNLGLLSPSPQLERVWERALSYPSTVQAKLQSTYHFVASYRCYLAPGTSDNVQGDHVSVKPGNVSNFDSCQGNVRDFTESQESVGEKSCLGKVA